MTEGQYVWATSGVAASWLPWDSPADPSGTTAENCVGIFIHAGFVDADCDSDRYALCEFVGI